MGEWDGQRRTRKALIISSRILEPSMTLSWHGKLLTGLQFALKYVPFMSRDKRNKEKGGRINL